jgi:hypothetical protein
MMQLNIIGVGIGAGAASALLFASVTSGSLLSIFLFYIAPLPILIAVLGWSHWAGMIAGIGAATALAAIFGGVFFLAFMAGTGLPAWWLGYLAMLARPAPAVAPQGSAPNAAPVALEWYPPGRLVLWASAFAALVVIIGVLNLGTDFESYRAALHQALDRIIRFTGENGEQTAPSTHATLINFLVLAIPPAGAVLATITNVTNLWLAGRIVKFSGRLQRPWPDLPALSFPRPAALAFVAVIALSFVGGLIGVVAGVAASSLLIAFGILGFAVLHSLTRGMKGRPLVLSASYASVAIFGWPILALCLLGLADAVVDVRARATRKRGPPATT